MTTLAQLGPTFVPTLVSLAAQNGIDPMGAVAVMLSESSLQSSAHNVGGGALGINQLTPVNYGIFAPLTAQQYLALSAAQQLPYAFKFWSQLNRKGMPYLTGRDLYWLNFLPATFVANAPDSYVIASKGSSAYSGNTGLDHGGKGTITAGDLQLSLNAAITKNQTLYNQIAALVGTTQAVAVAGVVGVGLTVLVAVAGMAVGAAGYLALPLARA